MIIYRDCGESSKPPIPQRHGRNRMAMNDFIFYDRTARLFLLCAIELCASVFRGLQPEDCLQLCTDGLADLEPLYKADKGNLVDLCEAIAELETFTRSHATDYPALCELCSREYERLFATNTSERLVPLTASGHAGLGRNTKEGETGTGDVTPMLAMKARLSAVGLEPRNTPHQPPDHLSTQLEYLYYLLSTGWRDADAEARAQATDFVRSEMQPWCARLVQALHIHDRCGLFAGTANVLTSMLHYIAD